MYMPGLLRTASRPSRSWIDFSSYAPDAFSDAPEPPFADFLAGDFFEGDFFAAISASQARGGDTTG
jgi:hypothetical protein